MSEGSPAVVHGGPFRVFRGDGDGKSTSGWRMGGEETELAEVFSSDSPDGTEDERGGVFRRGMSGGRNDGIGEVVASVFGNACPDQG